MSFLKSNFGQRILVAAIGIPIVILLIAVSAILPISDFPLPLGLLDVAGLPCAPTVGATSATASTAMSILIRMVRPLRECRSRTTA